MNPSARPPVRGLLLDLSGTLHVGSLPTERAVQALARLRTTSTAAPHPPAPIPLRFCSNTSKEGRKDLYDRLVAIGFDLRPFQSRGGGAPTATGDGDGSAQDELWTSLGAVNSLLRKRGLTRPLCILSDSARADVLDGLPPQFEDDTAAYDSVVVGLAPALLDYAHLTAAFRVLLPREGGDERARPLIATHRARYVRTGAAAAPDNAHLSLGPGPFVAALEAAAGVAAEAVGKPSRAFFELVVESFGFGEGEGAGEARIVVVGDDIEADLGGGAVELGLWRVLVQTGKYRCGDETRHGVIPPDEVYPSFAAFVDSLF